MTGPEDRTGDLLNTSRTMHPNDLAGSAGLYIIAIFVLAKSKPDVRLDFKDLDQNKLVLYRTRLTFDGCLKCETC